MTIIDTVNQSLTKYPSLYVKDTWEDTKFDVLHHYFIILGNGIEWAYTKNPKHGGYLTDPSHYKKNGEWERKYDLPYGKEKFELNPLFFNEEIYDVYKNERRDTGFNFPDLKSRKQFPPLFQSELNKILGKYVEAYSRTQQIYEYVIVPCKDHDTSTARKDPYPNFQKQYSCFWEIEPELIKEDWRLEGIKHLEYWQEYFNDAERVKGFFYYKRSVDEKSIKGVNKLIDGYKLFLDETLKRLHI